MAHPRRRQGSSSLRDDLGRKECVSCLLWMSVESFHRAAGALDGLQSRCKDCSADYNLMRQYGVTRAEVQEMLDKQGGCAGCGSPTPVGHTIWAVDHNHDCCPGKVSCGKCLRGILCFRCNMVLGAVTDRIDVLHGLIKYLETT